MNKVLFATFVAMLSLGIALYIHQNSDALSDPLTSGDNRVVAEAYVSCSKNSATATLSIDYAQDEEAQDGDLYKGSGYCYAQAGPNTRRTPRTGTSPFWLEANRTSFLWWTWISVKRKAVTASMSYYMGSHTLLPVNDISAVASGEFEETAIYAKCPLTTS